MHTTHLRHRIEAILEHAHTLDVKAMIENLLAAARYADAKLLAEELDRREARAEHEAAIARLASPRVCEGCGG